MINLPSVKTFVYSGEQHIKRRNKIKLLLEHLNFKDWSFVIGKASNPYWLKMHQDWLVMLETSTPFLILEDDIAVTENYKADVEFPLDAQIVYFGGSPYGPLSFIDLPGEYIKLHSMYSNHAIMITCDKAKDIVKQSMINNSQIIPDVVISECLKDLKAYCIKKPFWYQNDGHNESATLEYYKDYQKYL